MDSTKVSKPFGCDTAALPGVFCEVRRVRILCQIVCGGMSGHPVQTHQPRARFVPAEMNKRPLPGRAKMPLNDRKWVVAT